MNKILSVLLCAVVALAACTKSEEARMNSHQAPVSGVTLNKTTLSLAKGAAETLIATVLPDDADSKDVVWSSSDPAVAAVSDEGEVTGVALGNAEITVTTVDRGKTAICQVEVVPALAVYVAGYEFNSANKLVAKVWKNGVATVLGDETRNSIARAVNVSGSDVYVAGYQYTDGTDHAAVLWKNGVAEPLQGGSGQSEAYSVFVSGNDVYVAGDQFTNSSDHSALLWKNGVVQSLSNASYSSAASVFVSGGSVYVGGTEARGGASAAVVWKDGVATVLPGGTDVSSIFVSGSDVHAAGLNEYQGVYWKNGAVTELTSPSTFAGINSVFVADNGDVYVAGHEAADFDRPYVAKVWKNGVAQALSSGAKDEYAYGVQVVGGDVYVAGYEVAPPKQGVKVWKNGTATMVTDQTMHARGHALFVAQ